MNRFIPINIAALLACGVLVASGCTRPVAPNPRISTANVESLKKAFGAGAAEAGPAAVVAVADPTGWSTLKGKFVLAGAAPGRTALVISKDPQVCAPGGKTVLDEKLVVDGSGGIEDVVVYLVTKLPANNPKWEHPDLAAQATAELVFDQKECVFLDHVFVMRSTQTLLIKNSDPVGHNTSINPSAGSKAQSTNVLLPALSNSAYKPVGESAVPNSVSCSIHPWMSALLLTRNNPYYAVTKPDGTFVIKDVPAGVELEFAVWQEKAGFIGSAKVQEGGGAAKDETWKKGRFKRKLTDKPLDLTVTVDAALFSK